MKGLKNIERKVLIKTNEFVEVICYSVFCAIMFFISLKIKKGYNPREAFYYALLCFIFMIMTYLFS